MTPERRPRSDTAGFAAGARFGPRATRPTPTSRRVVGEILRTLGSAGGRREESGQSFRRHLVRTLTRFFRSHVASPVALVCHVGLVLIDVERLRGGLIRRSLFGDEEERIAT